MEDKEKKDRNIRKYRCKTDVGLQLSDCEHWTYRSRTHRLGDFIFFTLISPFELE
jgi:hypothetical protein